MQGLILATLIPARPDLPQVLTFSAMGFCVVIVVLVMISLVTELIGKCFVGAENLKKSAQAKKAEKSAAASVATPSVSSLKDIPADHAFAISAAVAAVLPDLKAEGGELIAVIAAAASEALDADVRVVSMKPVDMAYARQGRMQMYSEKNYTPKRF